MIRILIVEEYGYRFWGWYYPGDEADLINDYRMGKTPIFQIGNKPFRGRVIELENDLMYKSFIKSEYFAHAHEEIDSYLLIRDKIFPVLKTQPLISLYRRELKMFKRRKKRTKK